MKSGHWAVLCLLGGVAAAADEPASLSLAELVAAHGGENALKRIEQYAARLDVTDIWARQSPTPGPPWRQSDGLRCHSMDLAGGRYAEYERRMAAGFYPFHSASWLEPEGGWRFNIHDGWRAPADPAYIGERLVEAMRFAPTLMVRAMAGDPDRVTAMGATEAADAARSRYRFEPASGPHHVLSFDNRTRMLRELAVGEATVRYDGYEMLDGFPVSRRMSMQWRGETVWRIHLKDASFNWAFPPEPDSLWELPTAEMPDSDTTRRFQTRSLAPGIHLIGEGDRYQLFVEFRDFAVALGGVAGVEKRLAAFRAVAGAKPLRYALISHHHADHLAGVPALVDAGAVLVISPAHEKAVRNAAGPGRTPRFAHVTDRSEITDGDRTLEFRELGPTRHSRHILGAWLPAEKILFTADLFVQAPGLPVRAANPPIQDLHQALQRLQLDATRFVDPHSPAVPNLADLELALKTTGRMSGYDEVAAAVCPP